MKRLRFTAALLGSAAGIALLSGGDAQASGFALKEQSGAALGNAFAGATAGAEDISYMFFNPAGLTRHSGTQVISGASLIAPKAEGKDFEGTTAFGSPITGDQGGGNVSVTAVVPNFYAMTEINDRMRAGVGINVPFGLETDFNDDWIGRYHALNSELLTININPTLAYKVTSDISIGAGAQIEYIDATLSNAIDFGSIGAAAGIPGAAPTQQDGFTELEGDDWGFGFTLGALYEPLPGTRLGVGYRSQVTHELEGDTSFELDDAGVGAAISAATGAFVETPASAKVKLPDVLSFGLYHEVTSDWAVMAEAQWTRWSKFQELRIQFDNPAQAESVTEEDWDDVWFGAVGVTYSGFEDTKLRLGYAFDQSPIPDSTRTPRIPGNDRHWISLGANYAPMPWLVLDAGYTHIFLKDSPVDLSIDDPGGTFRGDLEGEFESSVDIVSVQATVRF